MDFKFTDAQLMLQKVAREFAENEVGPIAAEIDATGRFPRETFDKMAKIGFTGIGTPVEYGGSGGNDIDKVIVVSEIAKSVEPLQLFFQYTLFLLKLFKSLAVKNKSKNIYL